MCDACREAHTKTRLTKSHVVEEVEGPAFYHPILDDEQGGRGEDEAYLISVYRCPTRVQPNQDDQVRRGKGQVSKPFFWGEGVCVMLKKTNNLYSDIIEEPKPRCLLSLDSKK